MVLLGSKQSIEWYRSLFDGVKLSFAICNRDKAISPFLSLLANNDSTTRTIVIEIARTQHVMLIALRII